MLSDPAAGGGENDIAGGGDRIVPVEGVDTSAGPAHLDVFAGGHGQNIIGFLFAGFGINRRGIVEKFH